MPSSRQPPAGIDPAVQRRQFRAGPFTGWILVGALWSLSLAAALSIGVFLLPVALAATVYMSLGTRRPIGWPGALAGISVIAFYLAFLHRHGPGRYCTGTGAASMTGSGSSGTASSRPGDIGTVASCTELLNPWMFLGAGLLLLVACGLTSWYWYTRRSLPQYRR